MVTLYTKDYCPYCVQAKNLLTSLGVSFEEIDVTHDNDTLMKLIETSGLRTVPQIFVGNKCLGGYTDIAAMHARGELMSALME